MKEYIRKKSNVEYDGISKGRKRNKKTYFKYLGISLFSFLTISSINLASTKFQLSNEYVNKNNAFSLYHLTKGESNYVDKNEIMNQVRTERYLSTISKEKKIVLFNTVNGLRSFKVKDKVSEKLRKERNLNGEAEKTFFETMKNFTEEEVAGKTHYLVTLANNKKILKELKEREENYNSGKTEKITTITENLHNVEKSSFGIEKIGGENYTQEQKDKAKLEKWFYDIYEPIVILEDKKTAVIAAVFGNKKTKKIEIFYGGSNMPFSNRNSIKDCVNDALSSIKISKNYKAALEIAKRVRENIYISKEGEKFQGLEAVNGFSKGGGEALYVASLLNLKALIIDPSPVVGVGEYVDNNKILAIVPGDGEAFLNRTIEITGTYGRLNTLEQKVGTSEGKDSKKTSLIPAIPVSSATKGMFRYHFPDIIRVAKAFERTEDYIEKIKPEYYSHFKKEKEN